MEEAPDGGAREGGTVLGSCFRRHTATVDLAAKLGIQEKWSAPTPTQRQAGQPGDGRGAPCRWVLFMVSLVFTCEWIDRALLNVALEPMKIDLGLSDTQVGAVASASYWVATLSVLPIGRFADHSSRRDVIACALCICAPQTPGPQAPVSPAAPRARVQGRSARCSPASPRPSPPSASPAWSSASAPPVSSP